MRPEFPGAAQLAGQVQEIWTPSTAGDSGGIPPYPPVCPRILDRPREYFSKNVQDQESIPVIDKTLYHNRWIAVVRGRVVGIGLTARQAHRAARQTRPKDKPQLFFVDVEGTIRKLETKLS